MCITAVDASKDFNTLNHKILFDNLQARKVPHSFVAILCNCYSILTSAVRLNGVLSSSCGV